MYPHHGHVVSPSRTVAAVSANTPQVEPRIIFTHVLQAVPGMVGAERGSVQTSVTRITYQVNVLTHFLLDRVVVDAQKV